MTLPQREQGVKTARGRGRGGGSCGLSQAVNGDSVLPPEYFFSSFLQNQSPVERRPKAACLAVPRGKTVVLFISQLKLNSARC